MPEAIGAVSVGLLRLMNPTDAQVETIEAKLVEALVAKPKATVSRLHLADLYDRRGKYDKAAEQYRNVLEREPNNIVALNNLAWLLAQGNKANSEALDYINKAINGMGRRPDLLDTRGMVHLAGKETAKARLDLEEATAEAATPARLYHLARILHEERNTTRARTTLREAKDKGLQASGLPVCGTKHGGLTHPARLIESPCDLSYPRGMESSHEQLETDTGHRDRQPPG